MKPFVFLLAVIALPSVGCTGGDGAADVNGEVTLDGQPLDEAVIHFIPIDGQSRTESAFVTKGQFHCRVPIGIRRVEISCVKARPLRPGQDADSATGGELVPARYNTKSEVQEEVKKGNNELRFALSSK